MLIDTPARPMMLYLDMNIWVDLAVGCANGDQRCENIRVGLQEAVDRGRIIVPLSTANYLELWHRSNKESREDIGTLMRDISKYSTVSSTYAVRRQEVRSEVSRFFGYDEPQNVGDDLLGFGASHAFGSAYGRFRFVESLAAPDGSVKEGALTEPDEIWKTLKLNGPEWEWLQLVGTQEILENDGVDRTPEHRFGTQCQLEELELRKRLQQDAKTYNRLGDLVIMQEIQSLTDDINEICEELGCDPHMLFRHIDDTMTPPQAMHAFVNSLPSANTWARLREWKHRDFTHPWDQHDWTDLSSLSVALPYFDAVITEKRWAHLFTVSGLAKKYNTIVGGGIKPIETILERIA